MIFSIRLKVYHFSAARNRGHTRTNPVNLALLHLPPRDSKALETTTCQRSGVPELSPTPSSAKSWSQHSQGTMLRPNLSGICSHPWPRKRCPCHLTLMWWHLSESLEAKDENRAHLKRKIIVRSKNSPLQSISPRISPDNKACRFSVPFTAQCNCEHICVHLLCTLNPLWMICSSLYNVVAVKLLLHCFLRE